MQDISERTLTEYQLSDNDKAAIMQIKKLKEDLNGQCEIIGFTLEDVVNIMFDIWVGLFNFNLCCFLTMLVFEILIYNKNCMYNFISSISLS